MIGTLAVPALLGCAVLAPGGGSRAMPPVPAVGPTVTATAVDPAAMAASARLAATADGPAARQASIAVEDPPVYRYGLTLGGTGLVSLVFEYESNNRALEFALGTFSGRDVSLAVTAKQYAGGGALRAFAGAGFWTVAAFPPDQRAGVALIARVPVGVDWHAFEKHAAGLEINFNRALAMRRPDAVDERPPRTRFVPLPAFYYRFADPR